MSHLALSPKPSRKKVQLATLYRCQSLANYMTLPMIKTMMCQSLVAHLTLPMIKTMMVPTGIATVLHTKSHPTTYKLTIPCYRNKWCQATRVPVRLLQIEHLQHLRTPNTTANGWTPTAHHTPVPVPLHWQDQVKAGLDQDVTLSSQPISWGTQQKLPCCASKMRFTYLCPRACLQH